MMTFAQAYHTAIRNITTEEEREYIALNGYGSEHDLFDANETTMEVWADLFGDTLFDEDGHISQETMDIINAGTAQAHEVGFVNVWQ